MEFINGNTMAEIAGYVITADSSEITPRIGAARVVYCKTNFLPGLFRYLRNTDNREYILITGMSDKPINKSRFEKKPKCIKRWFAVNAVYDHPDLIPIPLGIENHMGMSKGQYTDHKWLVENIDYLQVQTKHDVIYCNYKEHTNPKLRKGIVSSLSKKGFDLRVDDFMSYPDYCQRMAECKYVLCPPGNGIDTHRLWEALYMGCVPITLESRIYQFYDLPIIQVKSWEDLTGRKLNRNRKFDYCQLYMSYWKEKIENGK